MMWWMRGILAAGAAVHGGGSRGAAAFANPPSRCALARSPPSRPRSTAAFYRDGDDVGTAPSDFQSRMRDVALRRNRATSCGNAKIRERENVLTATSLEEFARVVERGRDEGRVVAARFVASWCKKCHALRPSFDRAAAAHPRVLFVEVPVLATNFSVHQGLGVETVPFGHVYHPARGLVVETPLSRKTFAEFEELLRRQCGSA